MEKSLASKTGDRVMGAVAVMAWKVTDAAVNCSCMWFFGQDKMPEKAKKLRKF